MHETARAHMKMCIDLYLDKTRHYRILDFGSRQVEPRHATHRDLLAEYDHEYFGADVKAGRNVDIVMKKPYRIPVKSDSFDVAITGQAFEHIAFPWVSFMELARVVKPGGLVFLVAPSRGPRHGRVDCWRFYPDAMRAFAAISRMNLVEVYVDLPRRYPTGRPNHAAVEYSGWGDAVGVFRKPQRYSKLVALYREVNVRWANRVGGVDHIALPPRRPRRRHLAERLTNPGGRDQPDTPSATPGARQT